MTNEHSIRITEADLERVRALVLADLPKEGAAFLLAGRRTGNDGQQLIVRRVLEIPKSEYRHQDSYHLEISTRAINGLIALCEKNKLGVILCHSHPTYSPYSSSDDFGEKRIAETLRQFIPNMPVGSLLISAEGIQGRIWQPDGTARFLSSLTIVGRRLAKIALNRGVEVAKQQAYEIYDRQIRAFGREGQAIIAGTKVGIVGLGGTGSPTAEQLVRLGVKDVVLIDKDDFDRSNLSRLYGSTYADAYPHWWNRFLPWKQRSPKVELVANHLKRINPDATIRKIKDNVVHKTAITALLDRDVIFCCTDEHWGRSVINQLAYQYLIPVINMGMRIDSEEGRVRGAAGFIHILRPGKPCLWCYDFLNADRIRAESLPAHQRERLLREGYIEDIDTPAPSVISITTSVSATAVTMFLQLVTDFMGQAGDLSCLQHLINGGNRETRNTGSRSELYLPGS